MNILFLSTENPYPPDHGHHLRTYYVLRHLAEANQIFFVGFAQDEAESQYKRHLESFCASVDIFLIPSRKQRLRYGFELLRNLFSPRPFTVQRYFRHSAKTQIKRILREHPIDLVHFDMVHLAPYRKIVGAIPSVLVNHNVESLRLFRLACVQKNLAHAYLLLQFRKMRRFERHMGGKFDRLIAVSAPDAAILQELCQVKSIDIVPNGVDADFFKPNGHPLTPDCLVWVGGMNGLYNQDAVDYFLDEIFPKLHRGCPTTKVIFVGQAPTTRLQEHNKRYPKNIEITGYAEDVRPYMQQASVIIAPMRCGSGTKIKVLNAMAMGKAVVTTTVGAEGIHATSGREIIIADSAQAFADQILALLQNPQRVDELGARARKIIESYYDWRIIYNKMDTIYNELVRAIKTKGH